LHRNAKLTPAGRHLLVGRITAGRPVAHVAAEMGIARQTAYRWWRRWLAEGEAGLEDRPCRPLRSPYRTPRPVERRIARLRRLGPVRLASRLGLVPSTVYRVRPVAVGRRTSVDRLEGGSGGGLCLRPLRRGRPLPPAVSPTSRLSTASRPLASELRVSQRDTDSI